MEIIDVSMEGFPIYYDSATKMLKYKDTTISYFILKRAWDSSMDRIDLQKDLTLIKGNDFVNFGCLIISKSQCKQIIKKINETNRKSAKSMGRRKEARAGKTGGK